MAYSATTAETQILTESAERLTLKCLRYVKTANDEVDVLKVNAETLLYRTFQLIPSSNAFGASGLPPGTIITSANAVSNVTAAVVSVAANGAVLVTQAANTTVSSNAANSSMFNVGEVFSPVSSGIGGSFTLGSVVTPKRVLELGSIQYAIAGDLSKVGVEWGGLNATANMVYTTIRLLTEGTEYIGRSLLQTDMLATAAANSDGNLYISTYDMLAETSYDLTFEIWKVQGFAEAQAN